MWLCEFHSATGNSIVITPEGKLSEKGVLTTPKLDETEDFQCLGYSNWAIGSLWNPFVLEIFIPFHLHTGEPILITPEGQ